MILKNIDILNFKNIRSANLEFSDGVNCLFGMNGMGKSNMLEAIYFLSLTRPMTAGPESGLICHSETMMLVKGDYLTDAGADENVACGITREKGKRIRRNGKEYRRISEHIGRFPIVSVTPGDTLLITGPGEERRKLMDMVISQAQPDYLPTLMKYSRALDSRNRMLKAGIKDTLLYESVELMMQETSAFVNRARREWVEQISPVVTKTYQTLSGGKETVKLSYKSTLNEQTLKESLEASRNKDMALGFTTTGIHRDDLRATIDGYTLKYDGSQGQMKTFTIALRLSIFHYLKDARGIVPILLLDDIFDKLDASRVENIMREVSSSGKFGQIFITDTNRKHLDTIMKDINGEKRMFTVIDGVIAPANE